MRQDGSRLTIEGSMDEATLRPVVRAGVVLASAVFFLVLIAALPGLEGLLPLTPLTLSTVVFALIALVISGVLISVAPRIETVVQDGLAGPADVVSGVAAIAKSLVVFFAVLVAYRGLDPAVSPLLTPIDAAWTYEVVFLLFAIGPLGMIGYHLYRNLDPLTDFLTREVATAVAGEADDAASPHQE